MVKQRASVALQARDYTLSDTDCEILQRIADTC